MIWTGKGSDSSPHVPALDTLIGLRWQAKGLHNNRHDCLFASTSLKQAQNYAQKGLYRVLVSPTARVSWIEGVADVILDFESYLRYCDWDTELLADIQGDVSIANVYARDQNTHLCNAIDAYLSTLTLYDLCFQDADLSTHKGEVWICGDYTLLEEHPNGR